MMHEDSQRIIAKFKLHGHSITRKSLQRTQQWLREAPNHSLDKLVKQLDHLALESSDHERNLQHALHILSLKQKNLNSYEDLLDKTCKRSIYAISPYEYGAENWFVERPERQLFEFRAEERVANQIRHFKRLSEAQAGKDGVIGVLYENYSNLNFGQGPRLMLQSQVVEIELEIPQGFKPTCLLLAGCTYRVKGRTVGKDLSLIVESIELLEPPTENPKNSLLKQKFKAMCENITSGKENLGFNPQDFVKYDTVYTPMDMPLKPLLVFGGVTVNRKNMQRLSRLVGAYPQGVGAVVLLLSAQEQEDMDFSIWLGCKVFLIPHVNSPGPRILPKLPLLEQRMKGSKVLTNPARISFEGRQIVLANYPMIRSIHSNSLMAGESSQLSQEQMVLSAGQLLFSQGNAALTYHHYWPQYRYFNLHNEATLILNDPVADTKFMKVRGKASLATTGNFDLMRDFLAFMTQDPSFCQVCEQFDS